jgi:spore coat protein A
VVGGDVYNTTGDTHPLHFHLANVQLIGSAPFANVGTPDSMNPGYVTRDIMQFSLPSGLPFPVPGSSRAGLMSGHEYVWHCQILEHEEHDMMRPIVVML